MEEIATSFIEDLDFSRRDPGEFTKVIQAHYGHRGYIAPEEMLTLLVFLDKMVGEALDAIPSKGEQWAAPVNDAKKWQARSAEYRRILQEAIYAKDHTGKGEVFDLVFSPLIVGWWPGESQQKMLDAVEPVRIAHGVEVSARAMEEAWEAFKHDSKKAAEDIRDDTAKAGKAVFSFAEWLFDPEHRVRLLVPVALVLIVPAIGPMSTVALAGIMRRFQ